MQRKNLDLSIILLIAAINVGWALLPDHPAYLNVIGIILALPLVFVVPGYALTEALFKRSTNATEALIRQPALQLERPFKASDRLIIGLGLSLALVILSGFILNMLPTGLQALSWVVFLSVQAVIYALIAAYRRRQIAVPEQSMNSASPRFRITFNDCLLLGLAIVVTIGSFSYATIIAEQQQHPGFTQLWMMPSPQSNKSCAILIGVHSNEASPTTYRIVMTINGVSAAAWSPVALTPQEDWNQLVPVKPAGNTMDVEVRLYRTEKPDQIYRNTHMTLTSSGGVIQCGVK
jgi:uncharacterized membrane protein